MATLTFKTFNTIIFNIPAKTEKFTVVSNGVLEDTELSAKARMLYTIIVKYRNCSNFRMTIENLINVSGMAEYSVRTSSKELREKGYLTRERMRDEKGHFVGYQYTLNETPNLPPDNQPQQDSNSKTLDNSCVHPFGDFPRVDNPPVENHQLLKIKKIKKENNKKENIKPLYYDNDDIYNQPKKQSTSINQENIELFSKKYSEVMNREYILTDNQKRQIDNLFVRYGQKAVVQAIENISKSDYLKANNTPYQFIRNFVKIFNGDYNNRVVATPTPTQPVIKQTSFNMINSRKWDYEELDRLEGEYIDRLIKGEYDEKTKPVAVPVMPVKQTRFNMIDSRDWDFDELERMEDERQDMIISHTLPKEIDYTHATDETFADILDTRKQELLERYSHLRSYQLVNIEGISFHERQFIIFCQNSNRG